MKTIVQIKTSQGKILESARWEINTILIPKSTFIVNKKISDPKLINFMKKAKDSSYEFEESNGQFTGSFWCVVDQLKHMMIADENRMETLAIAVPEKRITELCLTYIFEPSIVDQKFIQLMESKS